MRLLATIFLFLNCSVFAQTVYKTPSGTKYHLASCRMVKNVSSKLSVESALRNGLSPCGICRPPFRSGLGIMSAPAKKPAGFNSKNRCRGITKSGSRCKRNTRIGNDYCFQHLP